MARIESVRFAPRRAEVDAENNLVNWRLTRSGKVIEKLPNIFWKSGLPWREANIWLLQGAIDHDIDIDIKTVFSRAAGVLGYATWLEETDTDWWDFPLKESKRCLKRYRGYLIGLRKTGSLAPSTVSQRMNVAIRLTRWLRDQLLLSSDWPLWTERTIGIHIPDPTGVVRILSVATTDLSISNRRPPGTQLEDGLRPVSLEDRDRALILESECASEELFLMLSIGFFCGMRIGTIASLKVQTLERAVPDPDAPGFYRIAVGPRASPSVATKFGVDGQIPVSSAMLNELQAYASCPERLKREMRAAKHNKDLLFLTRYGNAYCQNGSQSSNAINVEMHNLRQLAARRNFDGLRKFHFHQSRCTFATELARLAIRVGGSMFAVAIVKEFLLHRHESTSWTYIRFIEKTKTKEKVANAFAEQFLGLVEGVRRTKSDPTA
ncbi:site-specific integrase [Paraburkholderia flagellata]|uniref:site-specific integrase n=1 Tax=Paraburkholderia flagellata TaxID=2883241 RepID=UPI001F2AB369|nr:site-specific integrase [Paraburkholderia flagellata]